jgi:hypothetical protein
VRADASAGFARRDISENELIRTCSSRAIRRSTIALGAFTSPDSDLAPRAVRLGRRRLLAVGELFAWIDAAMSEYESGSGETSGRPG